jgi:hypothetical protein
MFLTVPSGPLALLPLDVPLLLVLDANYTHINKD